MESGLQYNFAFVLLAVWSLFWTGVALWKAAKQDQKYWFIGCLIFGTNTAGLVSIAYLFFFSKKRFTLQEMKDWQIWKRNK